MVQEEPLIWTHPMRRGRDVALTVDEIYARALELAAKAKASA